MTVADLSSGVTGWRTYDGVKRAIDVLISLAMVIVSSPLWVVLAVLIRLTSRGPVFFRQTEAIGRCGRKFTLFKFRTMRSDASDAAHREAIARFVGGQALATDKEGAAVYKVVSDPRVTKIGRVLRQTGLDELPQFLNVLRGEMSIVGPRPPVSYEYEHYDERARMRLAVRPGITGLYQVSARSSVAFEEMIDIDLDYVARRSLALDLSIMMRTPMVMLTGRGAY